MIKDILRVIVTIVASIVLIIFLAFFYSKCSNYEFLDQDARK
jgi:hypothetical protein